MATIKGKFESKASPLESTETEKRIGAIRMMFEKRFSGALEATSVVVMSGIMNKELGSGGYIALERIDGILEGRKGTFCLQHSSVMKRGKPSQTILVVPDSGTDELVGLSGNMTIDVTNGDHFFTFDYSL
jgi:hypothetical protein